MAAFSYTGWARLRWDGGFADSIHFIDYVADRATLRVFPMDPDPDSDKIYSPLVSEEYLGHMCDHPAESIFFLHGNR